MKFSVTKDISHLIKTNSLKQLIIDGNISNNWVKIEKDIQF